MKDTIVGYVRELFVYPVKSMRGIPVAEVSCYWYGVNGDRKVAFTRSGNLSGFPWLTARDLPALLQHKPYFVDPESPLTSPIRVKTPDNKDLPLESPELIATLESDFEGHLSLLKLKRGTFDCMPLSIISTTTLETLGQMGDGPLDVRRFRPNILVDIAGGATEAEWTGAGVAFGARDDAARIQVNYPIERCVMVNLHPDSTESDPRVLKAVAGINNCFAGVYAAVSKPGTIRVGDPIFLFDAI